MNSVAKRKFPIPTFFLTFPMNQKRPKACYIMVTFWTLPWEKLCSTYIFSMTMLQWKRKRETNRCLTISISIWHTITLSPIRAFLSMIALLMCEFFPIPMGMPPFSARSFLSASVCWTTKERVSTSLCQKHITPAWFYLIVVRTH